MPADKRSHDPDAATAAYWRSVAETPQAPERGEAVEPAAQVMQDRGAREAEAARMVAEMAAGGERGSEWAAVSGRSTGSRPARRVRRRL